MGNGTRVQKRPNETRQEKWNVTTRKRKEKQNKKNKTNKAELVYEY